MCLSVSVLVSHDQDPTLRQLKLSTQPLRLSSLELRNFLGCCMSRG